MELCSRQPYSHSHSHSHESPPQRQKICRQGKLGRCYRLPCPFLHPDIPSADDRPSPSASALDPAKMPLCRFWALGKCRYGDSCRFLHTWNVADSFSFLTALEGHHKGIRGIALPSGSDKLYSRSKDKSVRVWDCNTGKVWNTQTYNEILLGGPVGQVHSLATTGFHPPETSGELLFAGQLVWDLATLQCLETLRGHTSAVTSVHCWDQYLLSASLDQTIKGVLFLCGTFDLQAKPVLMSAFDDNSVRLYDLPS
ncbi:hypothetical protein ACLOJK_023453 [Asimina triloba]